MQLIKGTYSKEEALEIVQQIIKIKINFHEEKISSSDNEEDIKMREKRIKDLQSDMHAFRKTINSQSGLIDMNALLNLNSADLNSHNFTLINGTFDVNDARDILMTAYQAKINFHNLKQFAMIERGEDGAERHINRVNELRTEMQKVKDLLMINNTAGQKVTINCQVSLQIESSEEAHVSKQELVDSY